MNKAKIVIGLGFGDEGKGTTVDYLTHKYKSNLNVKFNGGPQAMHHVHTPDGKHHTFSQLGSGSFHGANTYISEHCIVDLLALENEFKAFVTKSLLNPSIYINENCIVLTPFHAMLNRVREFYDGKGSCGIGFGACVETSLDDSAPKLTIKDISNLNINDIIDILEEVKIYVLNKIKEIDQFGFSSDLCGNIYIRGYAEKLMSVKNYFTVSKDIAKNLLSIHDVVIFEGAQGVLLDEHYGFNPHTTWSTTTNKNALAIIKDTYPDCDVETYGVIRSFSTRHGRGPFIAQDNSLDHLIRDDDNSENQWQGAFRVGLFDDVMLQYALKIVNIDHLMITHFDKLKNNRLEYVKHYVNRRNIFFEDFHIDIDNPTNDQLLKHSEELTKKLFAAKPVTSNMSINEFLNAFNHLPITISRGKTINDKEEIDKLTEI